jgi:serine/threonine protein kinase
MQITPERWRRIRTIFEAAVERPTGEREEFLDDACSGDPELLRQVGSLIVASKGAGEAMAHAIADAAADTAATVRVGIPDRLGHYRILDTLGEGGMGLVLLAERDDDTYRQKVAVKVIKQTLSREDVVRRFENERQILADLDHPAIARLLDGGATEEGVPYLVMEYVDGRPIDVYCREEGLDTEQRLQLVLEVCDAVSHAHHRFVVHRDLKPSNILVTADGSPKLLDFGIAKLVDPERSGAGLTRTGMAALTPEYASPEQVLGEPVTTASDVYSLGVLLYELVVGRSPYGDSVDTPAALVRAICEGRPERPSDVRRRGTFGDSDTSGPLATPRALRRELDWILLTALRKEPERRYASVDELAEDLRRLLNARPVHAHPDSWHYRTGKWLRRHWALATAAVLVVVALAGGLVARTLETRRAEQAAAESEATTEFLASLFFSANPYGSDAATNETTARDLLDLGAERLRTELADQPRVQARLSEQIAEIYLDLNLPQSARPLLEQAAAARARIPDDRKALTGTVFFQGRLEAELGEFERAVELLSRATTMAQEAYGTDSPVVAIPLYEKAHCLRLLGRWDEAEATLDRVIAIREAEDPPSLSALGLAHSELGVVVAARGDLDAAERHQKDALEAFRQAYGDRHPETAGVQRRLAAVATMRQDFATAAAAMREVVEVDRSAFGVDPKVAGDLVLLGSALRDNGELEAATAAFEDALATLRQVDSSDGGVAASAKAGLGRTLAVQGFDADAETLLRDAARMAPNDPEVLADLGRFLIQTDRPAEADEILVRRLGLLEASASKGHWQVAVAKRDLGACRVRQGHLVDGERLLRSSHAALKGGDSLHTRLRGETSVWIQELVEAYEAAGDTERAEALQTHLSATQSPRRPASDSD